MYNGGKKHMNKCKNFTSRLEVIGSNCNVKYINITKSKSNKGDTFSGLINMIVMKVKKMIAIIICVFKTHCCSQK